LSDHSRDPGARFVRALVRSARGDTAPAGAIARARARLGVGDAPAGSPFGLAGALLLAVLIFGPLIFGPLTFGTAWYPNPESASVASEVTLAECRGGVEAPPCSCSEPSRAAGPSGTMAGSSSGTDPFRSGSGG
jgi:hypothetical protein